MNKIEKISRKIARELLLKWRNKERYILERKIFPRIKNKKILLVGCAHYTSDYPKRLKDNQLWTIDIDPEMVKFGAGNHIIESIVNVDKYFQKEFFDVIILFGVFGYGLNDKKEAEKTLENCAKVLKKKGILIIGWNDLPGYNPINPRNLKNFNLYQSFSWDSIPSGYKTEKRLKGVFEFLKKAD